MGPSASQDFFLFLALFGGLFILWASTGGPDRTPSSGLFSGIGGTQEEVRDFSLSSGTMVEQRANTAKELTNTQKELERLKEDLKQARIKGESSPYEGMVSISAGRAREGFAQTEYLELTATRGNTSDIPITGWTLESAVTGVRATIGQGTSLPFPGTSNAVATLLLQPGERAYVVTGRSPIGVSFKINKCVGYFEQYQDFSPRLRRECASPEQEFDDYSNLPITNVRLEDDEREECRNYIDRNVSRCELVTKNLDEVRPHLSLSCIDFIESTFTYSGCVENHRFDTNFFGSEWRVFLGSHAELWREEREIIRLLDQNGKTVDILDY